MAAGDELRGPYLTERIVLHHCKEADFFLSNWICINGQQLKIIEKETLMLFPFRVLTLGKTAQGFNVRDSGMCENLSDIRYKMSIIACYQYQV